MHMRSKLLKGTLTVLGAVLLLTLGIFAADTLRGIDPGLQLGSVGGTGGCPTGMTAMRHRDALLCVDVYEASAGPKCPNTAPSSPLQSERNVSDASCYAASVAGALPWTFISLPQAERACAQAGKRLPTSDEWYALTLGTQPESCNIRAESVGKTGTPGCENSSGVFDAVGNVWEWVDETVQGNQFDGRSLPPDGYVSSVDSSGIAITSTENPDELYGKDYFWSKEEGIFGMIRGGFYASGDDAGLYTVNASVPTSFASQGVGFRCVEDVL